MEWLQNILCIVFLFSIYENFAKKVMTASEPFCVLNHLNSLTYYKLVSYKKNSVLCKMQQRKLKYSLKKRKNSFHLLYVLKELRNFKRKLFLCPPQKIGENTTNISKLLFFTINLHFVTSNQISTYRKLNFPLTSSIYLVFLHLEMQKRLKQTKACHAFSYLF